MASVIKVFKTLRSHWKKSTLAAVAGSYGVYYLINKHNENLIRREYCKLAWEYGQHSIRATEKVKKVTVFLNPAAKNGKAVKQFEKNAAPILHLAGLSVEILKSSHEGHVKDQVAALGATDSILVVGGDGTLAEVITGLLRRSDAESCSNWPIGVIPVGVTNTLARLLYTDSTNEVRWMCSAALALVKGETVPIDVMAIKDAEERTTFAVNHLRWSSFDDAKQTTTKYWYFGPLKHRMAFVFHTLSQSWPNAVSVNALYTGPKDIPLPPPPPVVHSIWTRMYWRLFGRPEEKPIEEEESDIVVPRLEKASKTTELVLSTNQLQEKDGKKFLSLTSGPEELFRVDFITEGWRRLNSHDMESCKLSLEKEIVGDVDIYPDISKILLQAGTREEASLAYQSRKLTEDETEWYTIDSERFEAGPVSVTLLPNKLKFFYQPRNSESETSNLETQR